MTHLDLIEQWARAFGITVAIELAVTFVVLAAVENSKWRRATIVLVGQFATHPVVWFVLPAFGWSWWTYACVAELWAWLLESLLYKTAWRQLSWQRALAYSLLANSASVAVGRLFLA